MSQLKSLVSRTPTFRTLWSVIKASPALKALQDAYVGRITQKNTMNDQNRQDPTYIRHSWDIAKMKALSKTKKRTHISRWKIKKV